MAVGLYLDVHVDHAIAAQLRLRNVDVITAQEDGSDTLPDDRLLERASQLGRPLVTHDIRFCAMGENWSRMRYSQDSLRNNEPAARSADLFRTLDDRLDRAMRQGPRNYRQGDRLG